MKKNFFLIVSLLFLTCWQMSAERNRINFDNDWRFYLEKQGETVDAKAPEFDDSHWRQLNLPHDWSIELPFDEKSPAGTGGGALDGGLGWYRKTFTLPETDKNKLIFIDFDGVYRNSEVWINGHYLGIRPYGFSSFRYELTPYLYFGNKRNVIAVKVDNSEQPNSRWYSGSGIYRNVWMVLTDPVFVDHWGTYITTPEVSEQSAGVNLNTTVRNAAKQAQSITLNTVIYNAEGKEVAKISTPQNISGNSAAEIVQDLKINSPTLWSDGNPYLYKAVSKIESKGKDLDTYETTFGVRYFTFDKDKGFILNGKPVKIKGVCLHHDLGCLGSAFNTRAMERQLEIMKEMGCNGLRTSHNPPAPELLDLCDRMGIIVMDEAFDMWKRAKTKYDYSHNWAQWHKKDLEDMIRRDRNHPSIFIWSIGNEIPEQSVPAGDSIARELSAIVKSLDNTRPITSACNRMGLRDKNYLASSSGIDLVGINYHLEMYDSVQFKYPGRKYIATETTSAFATRGEYNMPSEFIRRWADGERRNNSAKNSNLTCSSYDNCSAAWGSTHEETWKMVKKRDYISGMFIWTGFDYIGEPTPYPWPARSSYFGIVDLCGFPKDAYYMYQSEWTNKPVLHIFPHWNWKQGDTIDVWAYTNCQEVELFLNGKSLGTKRKQGDELHLKWPVVYEPGTLKAIGRTDGKEVLTEEVKTASAPAKIIMSADRSSIKADGSDLSFVTVKIVDKDGIVVPHADNLVNFHLSGEGTIAGTDNGNPISLESFQTKDRKAFNGLCLAVIQSEEKAGTITLKATAEGLQGAEVVIKTK